MGRQHRNLRVAGGLAAAVLLSIAGCTADNPPTQQRSACVAPGITDNEIRVGFIYPDTGALAKPLAAVRSGFEARIGLANDDGGIYGRRIVATVRDDRSNPATNDVVARQLVERANVFGLVEATTAASGGAEYLRQQNVPVAGIPAETIWSEYPNMFAYSYIISDGPSVDTFGQYTHAQGGTRAAVVKTDLTATSGSLGAKIEESLRAAGVTILPGPFLWNLNTITPTTMARQLKESGADTIISTVSSDELADIMQAGRQIGLAPRVVLAANGYDPSMLARRGPALAGLTTFVNYVPFEERTPPQEIYLAAMSKYAPQLSRPDQELALVTYILTDVFLHGLELAGPCPTRAGFISSLRKSSNYSAHGLLAGNVDFTRDFGQISTCFVFVKVNQAGTGYEVMRNSSPGSQNSAQWCGNRLG